MPTKTTNILAINGGPKVRTQPMPPRRLFGPAERKAVERVFDYYQEKNLDFGYQGPFEQAYTDAFIRYLGVGGYADGVATGTGALYVALASLDLPKGSEILLSALAGDPGTVSSIILRELVPRLVDCGKNNYTIDAEQVIARMTPKTRALFVVHAGGMSAPMIEIMAAAKARGVLVLEDCSQAHGAMYRGQKVGTFGDVAAFSTMSRKNHATGGCGGVVYTKDQERFHLIRAHSDRGKPSWRQDFDDKEPGRYLFPALNWNIDEVSCAIGSSTLERVEDVRLGRLKLIRSIEQRLVKESNCCRAYPVPDEAAPFFLPVMLDSSALSCSKREFAEAVAAEGIPINPHYRTVVSEWPWVQQYLGDNFVPQNAISIRDRTFNLLFHEAFGEQEINDIIAAIVKVERAFKA